MNGFDRRFGKDFNNLIFIFWYIKTIYVFKLVKKVYWWRNYDEYYLLEFKYYMVLSIWMNKYEIIWFINKMRLFINNLIY